MSDLTTFPVSDPRSIDPRFRLVRRITVQRGRGIFPIIPFFGVEFPSETPSELPVRNMTTSPRQQLFSGGRLIDTPRTSPAIAPKTPTIKTHPSIGLGFYWWIGDEVGREFFGFPLGSNPRVNQELLSRERIMKALFVLRTLPMIDVGHDDESNMLGLCWAVARREITKGRVERLADQLGREVVNDILIRLREFHLKGKGRELGGLREFLHAQRFRSSK